MQVSCHNQEMLRPEATLELELDLELELEAVVSYGTVSWLRGTCGFTTCLPSTVYSISVVPLGCSLRTTTCIRVPVVLLWITGCWDLCRRHSFFHKPADNSMCKDAHIQ